MNAQNAKDYLPLVQAMAEGKMIEVKNGLGMWVDCPEPSFGGNPKFYRIKPEPRGWIVVVDTRTNAPAGVYSHQEWNTKHPDGGAWETVEVVEVIK